jgi:pimeloyl-ACP methyl ester carboxylesterase
VGIGKKPPIYLKPGDVISVSVTGLGTLTNRVAESTSNPTPRQIQKFCDRTASNDAESNHSTLTQINGKLLHYRHLGDSNRPPIIFIHGLGGNAELFTPLITATRLDQSHSLHSVDLEGHGLSPTPLLSRLSIESFAADINGVFESAGIMSDATIIAHSLGCLVAMEFALKHPEKVCKLICFNPLPSLQVSSEEMYARAETVRMKGMVAVVDEIVAKETSIRMTMQNPITVAAIRLSLLGTDPEGYAKACWALAEASKPNFSTIQAKILILMGSEEHSNPVQLAMGNAEYMLLEGEGQWHILEDLKGCAEAVRGFLG